LTHFFHGPIYRQTDSTHRVSPQPFRIRKISSSLKSRSQIVKSIPLFPGLVYRIVGIRYIEIYGYDISSDQLIAEKEYRVRGNTRCYARNDARGVTCAFRNAAVIDWRETLACFYFRKNIFFFFFARSEALSIWIAYQRLSL